MEVKKIAVIGGGVSGLTAAVSFQRRGYDVIIFEKSAHVGGVWSLTYPGTTLQNTGRGYEISDFPWRWQNRHPTTLEILAYQSAVVKHFGLKVRLGTEVVAMEERPNQGGWIVRTKQAEKQEEEHVVAYVVIATGLYCGPRHRPTFPGEGDFKGEILVDRQFTSLDQFDNKDIAVLGNAKTALDLVTMASERAKSVHHVFRTPRWLLTDYVFGIDIVKLLVPRFGTVLMPSWSHPTAFERFIHSSLSFVVLQFWTFLAFIFSIQASFLLPGKGKPAYKAAKERLDTVIPKHPFTVDLRGSIALSPDNYLPAVVSGKIQPHHAEIASFTSDGIKLSDGSTIKCDKVFLALGPQPPTFSFLPEKYRIHLEGAGRQLYRHLIHPRIPNVGFLGFNHNLSHFSAVEIGSLWLMAVSEGDLQLPSPEAMEKSAARVLEWKTRHIAPSTVVPFDVSTKFQQYHDILLKDLGISAYRKLPNVFAEVFGEYQPSDYKEIFNEYAKNKKSRKGPLRPLDIDT